jgi:hypothetical protein
MSQCNWASIRYRDFWDVPRIFLVAYQGELYLFDCAFDEELEDFLDTYQVYVLPDIAEAQLAGSWEELPEKALRYVGAVPITEVRFDATKRQSIDTAILDRLTTRQPAVS